MGFRRTGPKADVETTAKELPKAAAKSAPASSGGKKTYHNDVLQILESKDGALYLQISKKFEGEITVNGKKVTQMYSKDPMVKLEEDVEAGRLTEERAQEIADKIPTFIKSNITLVTE